ncbi:hypothetical protein QJS10_CPB20g00819 [Acorus calamus]|uniref:non-specific serine/threonine protein kinase n=1 Tax=Acorus calamus TaxID=4465 RepID=A0AAV9C9V0_ACOCL|nr:hypothetical protein QJS10_CPB20g00819 [Acorus calamus]
MGNKIARTTQASATEYYLNDLPSTYNLVLIEVLGRGRFFKSILCKHDEGLVLVKVYFKRGDPLDLKDYERRLAQIRDTFQDVESPHVRPFQLLSAVKQSHEKGVCHDDDPSDFSFFFDTGGRRRCYLAPERFYEPGCEMPVAQDAPLKPSMDIFSLGSHKKKHTFKGDFVFQISLTFCAISAVTGLLLHQHHTLKTTGQISKARSFFSKQRLTHLEVSPPRLGITSIELVHELFLEGQPLFELSQLLAYRRGQYDPSQHLEKIPDSGIRKMIHHMIQLDPELRLSCESYLQSYASVVFPSYFSAFLHGFFSCLIPMDSDARVAVTHRAFHEIHKRMVSNRSNEEISPSDPKSDEPSQLVDSGVQGLYLPKCSSVHSELKKTSGEQSQLVGDINSLLWGVEQSYSHLGGKANVKIETHAVSSTSASTARLLHDAEQFTELSSCKPLHMASDKRKESNLLEKLLRSDFKSLMSGYNSQSDAFHVPSIQEINHHSNCEGMVLIASLLCSCIRSVRQPQLRRASLLLLMSSSLYIDDEDRLQHVLPYVIAMLSDPAAIVRCAAVETLCGILPLVRDFPPSDAKIFPEYILPMLSMLPDDPEESVRICYASNITKIALTAYRFLMHSQGLNKTGSLDKLHPPQKSPGSSVEKSGQKLSETCDAQLGQLRKSIAEIVQELVMGPKQTPNIRRAFLQDIAHLCYFFGQRQSNDFLLPILPAFLNDRDEQLRAIFYEKIVFVCFFVGQRSVEEYLLPYIEQALSDGMEAVIVNALECLSILCRNGFLRKRILLEMIERAVPLLYYPIQWVRRSVVTFIAASSEFLGAVDTYVYLSPLLRPFLQREPDSIASEKALLSCLKPPVSKVLYNQDIDNARSSDMLERQRRIWYNSPAHMKHWETIELTKEAAGDLNSIKISHGKESSSQVSKFALSEDVAKLRATRSSFRNASSAMDIRDSLPSEKLQFSGFISPHFSAGNSYISDGPSEGIPVYSFCMDRRDTLSQWNTPAISSSSMPWVDSVSKSFSMSSSVVPKLVSGSFFNIGSGPKQVFRLIQDTEGKEYEQSSYIASKLQDLGISDSLGGSSVSSDDASSQTDVTGFSRATSVSDSGWRPRGVLTAHLQEHRSSINDIAISNDHSFFVSASDDSTVKIWDTRKLEKDISFRSRLTYSLDGSRALCAVMLRGCAQVVVGACDGTLHMFSVDYISRGLGSVVERYSGIADVKKIEAGEGAILSVLNCFTEGSAGPMILYSTQRCGIQLWDTRTSVTAWKFKTAPEEVFYGLPHRENVPSYTSSNTAVSCTARPLVYVAAGCNEVSLWNAENGSCHQVFKLSSNETEAEMSDIPWALRRSTKMSSTQDFKRNTNPKYRIDELNEPPPRLPGVRALLPLPGGDLLTGGTDLKIRFWDHNSPDRSYCVCGPSTKGIGNDEFYDTKSSFGVQVVQVDG